MSQAGVLSVHTSGGAVLEYLTGNSGGAVGPDASHNIDLVGNNTSGINIVGVPASNLLTVVGIQSTTTQRGTVELATDAETIAGSNTSNAVTPESLKAKLGPQVNHSIALFQGSFLPLVSLGAAADGEIPIGSLGSDPNLTTITAGTGITVTNGPGSITISSAGADLLSYTAVTNAMSPYTVLSTDEYLGVNTTAGTVTLRLPNAPSIGRLYYIKDSTATAGTNAITVTTVGGAVNIDGATSYTMNVNYQSIQVIFNGTSYEVF